MKLLFKSTILFTSILLVLSLINVKSVSAADLNINFTDTSCDIIPANDPLFEDYYLLPTFSVIRIVRATNNSLEKASLLISVKNTDFFDSNPSLASILKLTIKDLQTNQIIYGPKNIVEWRDDGYILLSDSVNSGSTENYEFKVVMDNVGNEYQGKSLKFDLLLNCLGKGEVAGETDTRNPSVLPATGVALAVLANPLSLVILGIYPRRKKSAKNL